MIENKEEIFNETAEKILGRIKKYVEDMDSLSNTSEFTIDKIESMWHELGENTNQIFKEINEEIIKQVNEKEIIASKKKNICKKE